MAVLSVDLAYRCWSDLGVVVLERARADTELEAGIFGADLAMPTAGRAEKAAQAIQNRGHIACEIIPALSPETSRGRVDPNILAGLLNHLCNLRGIRVIMLDGPQAWKSRWNGLEHSRVSERHLNTAAKTGLPGIVKPVTYRAFAEFCLDVYDALCRRGWRRLETKDHPDAPADRVLVESYPHAAWKSLGLKPLPSKRRARVSDLAAAYGALRSLIPLTCSRPPNHDQLQAIVGGLPGLALEERNAGAARIVGSPPRREEGHWREGFIVLPVPPTGTAATALLKRVQWRH
jgi:hypothetical protein